jgi:hypothetical protein
MTLSSPRSSVDALAALSPWRVRPETSSAISGVQLPPVIPAKAGIQGDRAGFRMALDPGFRRDDVVPSRIIRLISGRRWRLAKHAPYA